MVVIKPKLAITKQPTDVDAAVGENAIFKISASGAVSYKWIYSKDGGNSWSNSSLDGYNTDTFTVPVTKGRYNYIYRCKITGADGQTLNSNNVVIRPKLAISAQPTDVIAAIGENAIFTISAYGATSYQWYYSKDGGNNWSRSGLGGYNTDTFTVPVTKGRYSYVYRCTITGADGQTLNSDMVVINPKLAITKQPTDVIAAVGEDAIFTISAYGATSYQWYYSKDGGNSWKKSGLDGNSTDTFIVPVTRGRYSYLYRCTIADVNGRTIDSNIVEIAEKNIKLQRLECANALIEAPLFADDTTIEESNEISDLAMTLVDMAKEEIGEEALADKDINEEFEPESNLEETELNDTEVLSDDNEDEAKAVEDIEEQPVENDISQMEEGNGLSEINVDEVDSADENSEECLVIVENDIIESTEK